MQEFDFVVPTTLEAAAAALAAQPTARPLAGGTDLLGGVKAEIYPIPPASIVSLRAIPGLSYIKEEDGFLCIGAMTTLSDIESSPIVKTRYAALAEAARRTASPQLRNMGTIAGNICQDVRCWYFRANHDRFDCRKKGGKLCYVPKGDGRYHSIFGGAKGCFAVNPSDTAPALCALDAHIITTQRAIPAEGFWDMGCPGSTVLAQDELVKEIRIPMRQRRSAFKKFAIRNAIDFPIVNCAVATDGENYRIFLNAVAYKPYRAVKAEELLQGKALTPELAALAAQAALADAKPLKDNAAKVEYAKSLVQSALLDCRAE